MITIVSVIIISILLITFGYFFMEWFVFYYPKKYKYSDPITVEGKRRKAHLDRINK